MELRKEVADKYDLSPKQQADELGIAGVGTVVLSKLTLERVEFLKNGEVDYLPMLTAKKQGKAVLPEPAK